MTPQDLHDLHPETPAKKESMGLRQLHGLNSPSRALRLRTATPEPWARATPSASGFVAVLVRSSNGPAPALLLDVGARGLALCVTSDKMWRSGSRRLGRGFWCFFGGISFLQSVKYMAPDHFFGALFKWRSFVWVSRRTFLSTVDRSYLSQLQSSKPDGRENCRLRASFFRPLTLAAGVSCK